MVSACLFGTLLEYPLSVLHLAFPDDFTRRVLMGIAMGLTAYGIIESPWGRKSGAHINPAVTIVHLRMGNISVLNSAGYIIFQAFGATVSVYIMKFLLGSSLTGYPVQTVVTIPYCGHVLHAFWMEFAIAFVLMFALQAVLHSKYKMHTAKIAGFLVCAYVIIAGPVSGFGMNPARSFASALPAHRWEAFWIYLFVPVVGMLLGNEAQLAVRKVNHKFSI
jgi:aquaporin Z